MTDLRPVRVLAGIAAAILFALAGWNMLHVQPQDAVAQFLATVAFAFAALSVAVNIDAGR